MSPPLTKRKFVSLFKSGGVMGEVFCLSGRCGFWAGCGCRACFAGGMRRERPRRERVPSFGEGGSLPPNLPLSPRTSPMSRHLRSENLFRFLRVAGTWGKFFCLSGRCGLVVECGFAHVLWVGCVGRAYAFHKCRLIPPHQSLTRQLPPKGKPSICCADMANMALHCGLPLQSALIRRLRRHLPPQRGRLWCVTFFIWTCFLKSRPVF